MSKDDPVENTGDSHAPVPFLLKNLVMDTYSIETEIIIFFDGEVP